MLTYVDNIEERVGVFTVVESLSNDDECPVESSRLAWDCRRLNLKCRKPPWAGVESPSALSSLDVSLDVLGTKELFSFAGDMPY
eukprot:9499246-Pyramimonas_sp.AAC.1